jgi:hypothetical protein
MQQVFVIIHVTYDWYRFQNNRAVALTMKSAQDQAEHYRAKRHPRDHDMPIVATREESASFDQPETEHIYIETHIL